MTATEKGSADALVVGAGPAGLSAAMSLSRLRKTSLIFDSGRYRNDNAHAMHNVIGWDGAKPSEVRERARKELQAYGCASFVQHQVCSVKQTTDGFELDGRWSGKMLILASGSTDILPDIPGFGALWGTSIVHCAFCHGTEFSDKAGGLLGLPDLSKMLSFTAITKRLTLLTNGDPVPKEDYPYQVYQKLGHQTITSKIASLEPNSDCRSDGGLTVHFEDDTPPLHMDFMVAVPPTKQSSPLAAQLGLEMTPMGDIAAKEPFQTTSMPNVFACGDAALMAKAVAGALSTGTGAGVAAAMSLVFDDIDMVKPPFMIGK